MTKYFDGKVPEVPADAAARVSERCCPSPGTLREVRRVPGARSTAGAPAAVPGAYGPCEPLRRKAPRGTWRRRRRRRATWLPSSATRSGRFASLRSTWRVPCRTYVGRGLLPSWAGRHRRLHRHRGCRRVRPAACQQRRTVGDPLFPRLNMDRSTSCGITFRCGHAHVAHLQNREPVRYSASRSINHVQAREQRVAHSDGVAGRRWPTWGGSLDVGAGGDVMTKTGRPRPTCSA